MLYKTSFRCFQHDKLYSDYLSQIWQIFLKHNHPHNLLNLRETKKQKAVQTEQLKKNYFKTSTSIALSSKTLMNALV
ncbi:hypothetical protein SAMN06264346_12129 [Chryseobacterium profundimaris]|uniref:Uncharacterized protein n=1 Tax=Chryseobacterium profundimaris TaxID=1387275 RepID=A0ABY1PJF3_9FLAO|nr:hypothetical protein SAMN06264346_12129 [Chryseobacterium profundimaris]